MPIDRTKFTPPEVPESLPAKAWRLYNKPIAEMLPDSSSLSKKSLDKRAEPSLKEADSVSKTGNTSDTKTNLIDRAAHSVLGSAADFLPTTAAKLHGFSSGALEAITPSVIAQAASAGTGKAATVANALVAGQGFHEAADSSLPTWKRALGGVTGSIGAFNPITKGAIRLINGAESVATPISKLGTSTSLKDSVAKLAADVKGGTPFSEQHIIDNYPELHAEVTKNPGGTYAKEIWGKDGKPAPPSIADISTTNAKQSLAAEKAKGALPPTIQQELIDKKPLLDLIDESRKRPLTPFESQAIEAERASYPSGVIAQKLGVNKPGMRLGGSVVDAAKAETTASTAADKATNAANVQEARNLNARDNYIAKDNVQTAKNLNTKDKFTRGIEKSADAATIEDAKRTAAGVAQSEAERQATTLDALKGTLTESHEPTSINETISGPGEHGGTERATFRRTAPEPPADEEGGGAMPDVSKAPVVTTPNLHTPDTVVRTLFNTKEAAAEALLQAGGGPAEIRSLGRGKYRAVYKNNTDTDLPPLDTPPPAPKSAPPAPKTAAQMVSESSPFQSLSPEEQQALIPHLNKAIEGGFSGNVEDLANELAGRLGAIKDGRSLMSDTGNSPDELVSSLRKGGGLSNATKSGWGGELSDIKSMYAKPGQFIGTNGQVRSGNGLFVKGGMEPDRALEFLQQDGRFSHLKSVNDLGDALRSAGSKPPATSPTQELADGLHPTWWKPSVPDVELGDSPILHSIEASVPGADSAPGVVPTEGVHPAPPVLEPEAQALRDQIAPHINPVGEAEPTLPGVEPTVNPDAKPVADLPLTLDGGKIPETPQAPDPSLFDAPAEPPVQAAGGAIPVSAKTPLEMAGEDYGAIKAAKKAGDIGVEPARTYYAKTAQRLNKESKAAAPIAEAPTGEPQVPSDSSDALTKLAPADQDKALADIVANFRKGRSSLGSESGAANLGLAARTAAAGVAGTVGYKEDPLGNKPLSALTMGAGTFMAPELMEKGIPILANGLSKASPYLERGLDTVNKLHNTGLLSPLSVVKKAAGDIGGLSLAAAENPQRAGDILKQFTTGAGRSGVWQAGKEGFNGPETEAATGLENFIQKGPLSLPGRVMGGLTHATKHVLGEAGFSEPEQRYYTLTDYPQHKVTEGAYNMLRGSKILQHLSPFARIGVNRLERGWEYSPFGMLTSKMGDPAAAGGIVKKALAGTAVSAGAYAATPDNFVKDHPIAASTISSLGGPLGIPIMAGMAMKNAHANAPEGKSAAALAANDAVHAVATDVPGLRLLEDVTSRDFPEGLARNYLSGYTNITRPIAVAMDPEEPDVSSKYLPESQKIVNRAVSNVPVLRSMLPKKGGVIPASGGEDTSKYLFDYSSKPKE